VILKLISGFVLIPILASKCPVLTSTVETVCAKFVPNIGAIYFSIAYSSSFT